MDLNLMIAAGECAIKVHGRSLWMDEVGEIRMSGIIVDLETPFDPKAVDAPQRKAFMDQMSSVLHKFHRKGIVHGDKELFMLAPPV
uniref:Uncharacterized protein n=1 Tax=Coccidioides posadasii RMSCC 3488 TaxID=454284 RepID=A0A0J6F0X0_COCPO|nr:hypothetical protein CPAG_00057 [Coccidioides posadasii RMSCC 3488]